MINDWINKQFSRVTYESIEFNMVECTLFYGWKKKKKSFILLNKIVSIV